MSLGIKFRRNKKENLLNAYEGEIVFATDTNQWGLGLTDGTLQWRNHVWDFSDNFSIGDNPYGTVNGSKHFTTSGNLIRKVAGGWETERFPMKRSDVEDALIIKGSIPDLTSKNSIIHKNYSVKIPSWTDKQSPNTVISKLEVDTALKFMENDGSTLYNVKHIPFLPREPITRGQTETGVVFKPSPYDPEIPGALWMGLDKILRISAGVNVLTGVTYYTQQPISFSTLGTVAPNNFGYINIPEGETHTPNSGSAQSGVTQVVVHSIGDRVSLNSLCYNLSAMKEIRFHESIDFSQITSMSSMLRGCGSLETIFAPSFDSSNVVNLSYVFHGCGSLEHLPTGFSTDSCTSLYASFQHCHSLLEFPMVDISNAISIGNDELNTWQIHSCWYGCSSLTSFPKLVFNPAITSFSTTWYGCSSLTSFPDIDTSNIQNFDWTWRGCTSLTSFPLLDFSGATEFNETWGYTHIDVFPAQDFSTIVNFYKAFWNSSFGEFNHTDFSTATSMEYAFYGTSFEQDKLEFHTPNVTNFYVAFSRAWDEVSTLTEIILDFDSAVYISGIFRGQTELEDINGLEGHNFILGTNIVSAKDAFRNASKLIDPGFEYPSSLENIDGAFGFVKFVNRINTSYENVTTAYYTYYYTDFTEMDMTVFSFNFTNLPAIYYLFASCLFPDSLTDFIFDTPSVRSINHLVDHGVVLNSYRVYFENLSPDFYSFYYAFSENINISSIVINPALDFNNVVNFKYAFRNSSVREFVYEGKTIEVLTQNVPSTGYDYSYFDGAKLTNLDALSFEAGLHPVNAIGGMMSLDYLPMDKGFDWSLFWEDGVSKSWQKAITSWWGKGLPFSPLSWDGIPIDWSQFNNWPDRNFSGQKFSVPPAGFVLPIRSSFYNFFSYCPNLVTIPNYVIPNEAVNFERFAHNCTSLEQCLITDLKNVTNLKYAFYECSSLIPTQMNISSVTDITFCWQGCTSIVDFPAYDFSSVTNAKNAFYHCTSMETMSGSQFMNCTNFYQMFRECYRLKEVFLETHTLSYYHTKRLMFKDCSRLKRVAVNAFYNSSAGSSSNNGGMFDGCSSLECVKGKIDTLPAPSSISNSIFSSSPLLEIPNARELLDLRWKRKSFENTIDCEE